MSRSCACRRYDGQDVERGSPRARDPCTNASTIGYCERLPLVFGRGLDYLRSRGLTPTFDCRWLPVEMWSTSPIATVLSPTKRIKNLDTVAAHGFPARSLMAGAIVWLWRSIELRVVGVQLEGILLDGRPVHYVRLDGQPVKRYLLAGSQAKGAAFVAKPLGWPDDPLHIAEGEPDALYLGAHVEGGVIGAHSAGLLPSLAPWCVGKHVTIWPDGDPPGEDGARRLRDILLDRGQIVDVRFGDGDVCERELNRG